MPLNWRKKAWLTQAVAAGLSLAAVAEPLELSTPRGAKLSVLQDLPAGKGPFPAIILAPGQGYHMQMPLLAKLSATLRERGVAVLRFDWAYYTQKPTRGGPAQDLATEIEDMQTVLDYARQDARFDASRLMVGGKSLGSLVTWRVLKLQPQVRGGLLLTPVCSREEEGGVIVAAMASNYPDLTQEDRPLAWIAGEQDPHCEVPLLYQYAGTAGRGMRVNVVGGNHSFLVGKPGDPVTDAEGERNLNLAAQLAADFVATVLKP